MSLLVAIILSGCGRTGGDAPRADDQPLGNDNTLSSRAAVSSSFTTSSLATSATSSVASSSTDAVTEYSVSVDKLEFTEGTDPELDKVFPVKFTLNKPLAEDAVLNMGVKANYGVGIFAGKIQEGKTLALAKGTTEFSLHLESYVNINPNADRYATWELSVDINGHRLPVPANNGITIIDDDKMYSRRIDVGSGSFIEFDLNGVEKSLATEKFTVTQVKGAKANFTVAGDKLRLLIPAPDNYNKAVATPRPDSEIGYLQFHVSSTNGENYDLTYSVEKATRFVSIDWDYQYAPDQLYDNPEPEDQYLKSVTFNKVGPHHLVATDALPPSIDLHFLNDRIRIDDEYTVLFVSKALHTGKYLDPSIDLQVSADKKSLQIAEADWEKIKKAVDLREEGVRFEILLRLKDSAAKAADTENAYTGQDFEIYIDLRVAHKTASVTLDEALPDAAIAGQTLFLVLSDSYKTNPGDGIVNIYPVTQRVLNINYLYSSDFNVRLVDLSGAYSGNVHLSLDKKEVANTAVTLKLDAIEKNN